jgi:hypothetical protein
MENQVLTANSTAALAPALSTTPVYITAPAREEYHQKSFLDAPSIPPEPEVISYPILPSISETYTEIWYTEGYAPFQNMSPRQTDH